MTQNLGPRVHVAQSFAMFRGINLWLLDHRLVDGVRQTTIAQPITPLTFEPLPEGVAPPEQPTLALDDNWGRALLDALSAHYGGTTDTRTLRADYEHERKRVDRMIDHLIGGGRG